MFLSDVFSYERISYLLNKQNPFNVTKEECEKIKCFLELIKYESQISNMVKLEIDKSIERRIEMEFHLKNYLQSIYTKMDFPLNVIYLASEIENIKKDAIFMGVRHVGSDLNTKEIENSNLVYEFMNAHIKHFNNFKDIHEHVLQKQKHFGFITSLKVNTTQVPQISGEMIGSNNKGDHLLQSQTGQEVWLIEDYTLFPKLHKLCVDEKMFENTAISINDFNTCFDLSVTPSIYPKFKRGSQIKFVYILSQFEQMNEEIAKKQFGIKGYKTQKRRVINEHKPKQNFINSVSRILNPKY